MTVTNRDVLVIGQGSIGLRHRDILQSLGYRPVTVSRRAGVGQFVSIAEALAATQANIAVIATETSEHVVGLAELAQLGFTGSVLVEKPLVAWPDQLTTKHPLGSIFVGYNLRFLPVVRELRAALVADDAPCIAAQLHVAQALSTWRPGRNNASVYSAHRSQGGGALRDLSHELDLALWLFGNAKRLTAVGGRYTEQTVDSDDTWSILAVCERCPQLMVTLNAIDEVPSRFITVSTSRHRYHADLIAGRLMIDNGGCDHRSERDESYRRMWQAMLSGEGADDLCDWRSGVAVVEAIAAAETASVTQSWVSLDT